MQLIDQHTKTIMEGCKARARSAGLEFCDETLEYIVTNRDLLELSAKSMIPSLYDYWVHDVDVLREKGRYELYPSNPYETVVNTRPAISFYNDNNPDWLNVMIFYHVLAHMDFFQNNSYFQATWTDDFNGEALSDKRMIARLRSHHGRWVDYVIEFARGMDNLVGYFDTLYRMDQPEKTPRERLVDYYFDHFLQEEKIPQIDYLKEIEQYNQALREDGPETGCDTFFAGVRKKHPEFEEKFRNWMESKQNGHKQDLLEFLLENSDVLKTKENKWMQSILEVVRKTSLFFQPQIRTKIMNEGWATYWHEQLFLDDDRISGHEVDFSRINSRVAALSRVGFNPYALGLRLFQSIEEKADAGKYGYEFEKLMDQDARKKFNNGGGSGRELLFAIRRNLCDGLFIRRFVDQDFVDQHRLFVAGKRLNRARRTWEYYVKSRNVEDYRQMLLDNLYHPPSIRFAVDADGVLELTHVFEGRPLVEDYIGNTMLGIEYLWGKPVTLTTHKVRQQQQQPDENREEPEILWEKVKYTMKQRQLSMEWV